MSVGINLNDRVAIGTGGSSGMGRACALRIAEAGAAVGCGRVETVDAPKEPSRTSWRPRDGRWRRWAMSAIPDYAVAPSR